MGLHLNARGRALIALAALVVLGVAAVAALGSGRDEPKRVDRPVVAKCPEPRAGVVNAGDRAGDEVALTFDDGPSANTPAVLDALARHDAKATFFVLGREIPGREEMLRRAVEEGHQVGNHSTSHDALPSTPDIEEASELITAATDRMPCVFRPPEGRFDDGLLAAVEDLGMTTVTWDVDTADWSTQDPAVIRDRVLAATQPGSIILMHDGGGERAGTVRAISAVINELHARGYRMVTVSDLLRGD